MFPYFLPYMLDFPCSIHWLHIFNNSTMNLEGSIDSFTSKVNNILSTWGNVSRIHFISWVVAWGCELGLTSHLLILRISILLISWMVVIVSSSLFMEFCWFILILIFPKASAIPFPSKSISLLSNHDNASWKSSFTSLANIFLSTKFVPHTFRAISPRNCSKGESIGKSGALSLCTNMMASWNLDRVERASVSLIYISFRARSTA